MKPRLSPRITAITRWLLCGLLLIWIAVCHGTNTVTTNLVGYNSTDKNVGHFTVDGNEGGFLQAHEEGDSHAVSAFLILGGRV